MQTTTNTLTVGRFTFDRDTGIVTGPADYMREQGFARIARIEAGQDVVFNNNPNSLTDPALGVLVSLQTDFAGWHGARVFNQMRGA